MIASFTAGSPPGSAASRPPAWSTGPPRAQCSATRLAIAMTSGADRLAACGPASAFKNAASFRAAAAVAASAQPAVVAGEPRRREGVDQRRGRLVESRADRPARARRPAGPAASGSASRPAETMHGGRRVRVARQDLHRVAPDSRRGMRERGHRRLGRRRVRAAQRTQAVQRPERVDRAGVQADRVQRAVARPARSARARRRSCRARPAGAGRASARAGCRSRARRPGPWRRRDRAPGGRRPGRPCRRSGRSARGSCRGAASRRRCPCRS